MRMKRKTKLILAFVVAIPIMLMALYPVGRFVYYLNPMNRLLCDVWSENSPYGQRTEFKVNWINPNQEQITTEAELIDSWLYELDAVTVLAPDDSVHDLEKDFNINVYSGEVTQRWVIYGAEGMGLPPSGAYRFQFHKDNNMVGEKVIQYTQIVYDYPEDVQWVRQGMDLHVSWTAPEDVSPGMVYKVVIFNQWDGTPDVAISQSFPWNATSGVLEGVPLIEGGNYNLHVMIGSVGGYAYSEYVCFTWGEGHIPDK